MMRILVISPYCMENEFPECISSVCRQTYRQWKHLVLRNLQHPTADDTVYRTFMQRAHDFDLFMKLDADMVIEDERFLEGVVKAFLDRPWMDVLGVRLYDWFTERLIPSLNTYRSSVRFPLTHDGLFTDPLPVNPDRAVIGHAELDGRVTHCKNPSPFQAFHYGMHRGLKVVYGDASARWGQVSLHMQNHQQVWRNFLKRQDQRLGLAALGGEMALAGQFKPEHVDYAAPYAREVFAPYETWTSAQLRREITRMRYSNWGWLPWWMRLGMVNRYGFRTWRMIARRGVRRISRMFLSRSLNRVGGALPVPASPTNGNGGENNP